MRYSPEGIEQMLKSHGLQYLQEKLQQKDIFQPQKFLVTDLSDLQESSQISHEEQQKLKKVQERLKFTPANWDLDLEEVGTRSEEAMEILNFCSLMDSDAIPVDVLRAVTSRENRASDNEEGLQGSFSLLSDGFSLMSCDDEGICSMHALVQQAVVKRMEWLGSLSAHCARLVRCLSGMIPQSQDAIRRSLNNRKVMALFPHVYSLCGHIMDSHCIEDVDIWSFLQWSCWFAFESHDYTMFKQLSERKIEILKNSSRASNPTRMTNSKSFSNFVYLGSVLDVFTAC